MAISPLALGIGLQGKYDFKHQAMLDLAREKGRAKAEADAETAKAKKRAPYEKAIRDVDTSGLLPYHAKLIKQKYANLLQEFESNPDDYSAHSASLQDINSSSKAFRDQAEGYKRLSIQQGGMPADAQVLRAIGTLSDGEMIQKEIAKYGPATSVAFQNDQFSYDNPKYEGLSTTFAKFVKDSMFDPGQGVQEFTIGDKKYGGADINTEVPKLMTATVMNTDNLKRSAFNDYLRYADQEKIPYDFSTEQGNKEFYDNTANWVSENAQAYVDALSKPMSGSKTQFINNNNMGNDMTAPVSLGSSGSKNLQYAADPGTIYHATGLAGNALGNHDALFAYTNRTFDMLTGYPIAKSGNENSTFNQIDAFYTLNQDIKYRGIPFRKGMIIPDEFRDEAIGKGYATVEILALGKEKKDLGKSFYVPMTEVEQTRYMNANKAERPLILEAQKRQNEAVEALKKSTSSGNSGGVDDYSLYQAYKKSGGKLKLAEWTSNGKPSK